ncbi:jupiter microtubule associated homolog 1 [Achroia grisella]|uniref:jupiter microtubule associated homolog 1 n=1 Tax=Achroia grisella TaxID=688607 RepID=UPI0027D2564D|nr:jupiter microtubule associated homolog 1 [Achroia grisella]
MTSTPFNVGLTEGTRSSSRVLRPPGGGHTDIFGGDPEPPRGRRLASAIAIANANSNANINAVPVDEPAKPTNGTVSPPRNGQNTPESPKEERVESIPEVQLEAPIVEIPTKTESKPEPAIFNEPAKAEAPKRVRVPPGGFSSGLW